MGDPFHQCKKQAIPGQNPKVFFDISIEDDPVGRLVFELWHFQYPKTVENFRALCTGEKGFGSQGKRLHYLDSVFHRIYKDFIVQGGDIINGNGTGGDSIYGPTFHDESTRGKHSARGLLAMANKGRHTNASQFYITLAPAPHLDGNSVVFGQLVIGHDTLDAIETRAGSDSGEAVAAVHITACGQLCGCGNSAYDESVRHRIPSATPYSRTAGARAAHV